MESFSRIRTSLSMCLFWILLSGARGFQAPSGKALHSLVSLQKYYVRRNSGYSCFDTLKASLQVSLPYEESLSSSIVSINGLAHFEHILENNVDKVVAVRFYSPVCRPCKALGAKFTSWAEESYSDKSVLFVDVDMYATENKELKKELKIRKIPLVHMYLGRKGKVEDFMCGPSKHEEFIEKLEKHLKDVE